MHIQQNIKSIYSFVMKTTRLRRIVRPYNKTFHTDLLRLIVLWCAICICGSHVDSLLCNSVTSTETQRVSVAISSGVSNSKDVTLFPRYNTNLMIRLLPSVRGLATILSEIQYLSLLQLLNYRCSSMPAAMCVLGPVLSCDCRGNL